MVVAHRLVADSLSVEKVRGCGGGNLRRNRAGGGVLRALVAGSVRARRDPVRDRPCAGRIDGADAAGWLLARFDRNRRTWRGHGIYVLWANGELVVTRNVKDFQNFDIRLRDPWQCLEDDRQVFDHFKRMSPTTVDGGNLA